MNSRNKAISVSNFDFSALNTSILHHKLKSVMEELINFCLSEKNKEFIGITRYGAIWHNIQEKYRLFFNKTFLKLAFNYLLDNCYFLLVVRAFTD